jgi:hypothetical protein
MTRLYSSPDSAAVALRKSVFDAAEIPCEVRNNCTSQAMPGAAFYSELWVLNDDDCLAASDLLADCHHLSCTEQAEPLE